MESYWTKTHLIYFSDEKMSDSDEEELFTSSNKLNRKI